MPLAAVIISVFFIDMFACVIQPTPQVFFILGSLFYTFNVHKLLYHYVILTIELFVLVDKHIFTLNLPYFVANI